jgi:hypothetical protein
MTIWPSAMKNKTYSDRRSHYINDNSNEKRVFSSECTAEWRLEMIKFTDCLANSEEQILKPQLLQSQIFYVYILRFLKKPNWRKFSSHG